MRAGKLRTVVFDTSFFIICFLLGVYSRNSVSEYHTTKECLTFFVKENVVVILPSVKGAMSSPPQPRSCGFIYVYVHDSLLLTVELVRVTTDDSMLEWYVQYNVR